MRKLWLLSNSLEKAWGDGRAFSRGCTIDGESGGSGAVGFRQVVEAQLELIQIVN